MERTTTELLRSAGAGDDRAWNEIVDRFSRLVWYVVRSRGATGVRAEDAYQTTWLRLLEHRDRIRDPERLGGWLATTARNEVTRIGRLDSRTDLLFESTIPTDPDDPGVRAANRDVHSRIWDALKSLSDKCRQLLGLLAVAPDLSYAEVGETLDMPIGSIGPTRARCLQNLRNVPEVHAIITEAVGR